VFQLSAILGQLSLDIKEVHALSTNDGYFLDIFIVVGWDHKVFLSKSLYFLSKSLYLESIGFKLVFVMKPL
jgi:hypothetical protein